MERRRDRVVGLALFALAAAWCVVAYATIPPGFGAAAVGPRDFPIAIGLLLALLSALLFASSFLPDGRAAAGGPEALPLDAELWAVGWTVALVVAYALLMRWFGFVVVTVIVVAVALRLVLNVRSPVLLIAMPLGLGFGIFFVMGRLMEIYLPRGTFIQPF
ncbi:MAG TPA: tripartite tricarboxylate transporter TctB family protein [Afifellaceae bacterium]|nr:tripartite tricarboxylate transporter TctB family protein [Afifellaceae bacterium]